MSGGTRMKMEILSNSIDHGENFAQIYRITAG
jgi:hypothetical protein